MIESLKEPRAPHIFISCGEASGDRYGAALVAALRSLLPGVRISALGGPKLADTGVEMVADSSDVAVMGFAEVVGALPAILKVQRRIWQFLASESVDMVIPIDFPGFNGKLASQSRKLGLPVFWLIAPQVWAWGSWRTAGFRGKVNRLGTILPFETSYFSQRKFDVFPMGHPLMEDYGENFPFEEAMARREHRLNDREGPLTIGVLPGSRRQELAHLLPVLKVTCQAVIGHLPDRDLRFVVSAAPGLDPVQISSVFDGKYEISQEPLPELMKRLDLALVCSGTASLEAALAGVPHELVYRTGAVNAFIARRLVRTAHIGLSNLILDRRMVREHFQDQATPLPLARNLLRWLSRPAERETFYGDVRSVRELCGESGVWRRTAQEILKLIVDKSNADATEAQATGNGA
ncbi:MAG: lipid-A-disaccharide synthase [Candidatus Krumholzibacteria bacterium]|nr:lipid-A-disaccharide synthase [Candidatus Krumholzibacteria bacterium]